MTKLRKIIALLLLFAAIGLCISGCGEKAAEISPEDEIISNLSAFFIYRFEDESIELDANDDWAAADLAAMGYGFSQKALDRFEEHLTACVSDEGAKTAVLARCIITMAALNLRSDAFDDASERLALAAQGEQSIYTMPYVLIALKQSGEKYEAECLLLAERILACELEGGGFNGFGKNPDADTTGPVLMALSYYLGDENVAEICIRAAQLAVAIADENGVIPRANGSSACSAGVFIPGLCAVGEDSGLIVNGLISLYDSESMYSLNSNDRLSREQAMRGLIASKLEGRMIYAFTA